MKSRITIEVDFENGNLPVIQILSRNSDDVRDGLIKAFYQKLGSSSWCSIFFKFDNFDPSLSSDDERNFKRIYITPIPQEELKAQAEIMLEQFGLDKKFEESRKRPVKK